MRPVNLIPPELRRGPGAPARTGSLMPYLVVGFLLAAVGGISAMVLTQNDIADHEAKIAELKSEEAEVKQRAGELAPYSQFRIVRDQRTQTVSALADSRFDWERVLRELAYVIPSDVWLINATGTAAPGLEPVDAAAIAARETVMGPALSMIGCAPGQEAVARFVAALEDIDGVTRVGVQSSKLPDQQNGATLSSTGDPSTDCRTRDFIARFEIVVAFDEVVAGAPSPTPAPQSTVTAAVTNDGVSDAVAEQAEAEASVAEQTAEAQNAVDTLLPK